MKLINVVMAGAVSFAQIHGFGEKDCRHIELILEEVLSNVIKYDYIPGQIENIVIEVETTTLGMSICIKSKGIPLDIDAIKTFEQIKPEEILQHEAHGLGILLIKSFADEVVYTNKGKEGQEVRIEKYLPYTQVNHDESPVVETVKADESAKIDFYIRRINLEEAPIISRLAYYAYNLSYIYDHIYYPDRVKQLNQTDELMSYVAVNKSNEEILGHCALIQDENSDLKEMAVAFVNPAYRGLGCLKDISKYQIAEIEKMGLRGVFANAVTFHPYSQKSAAGLGLNETALFISRLSALKMNKINAENDTRDSLLYLCKYFNIFQLEKVFVPSHHHEMIARIFANISAEVQLYITAAAENDNKGESMSVIETKADAYSCAHIYVKQYGTDILKNVNKTLKAFCVDRVETVYLFLPLDCPETSYLCSEFEDLGFFFGGVRPGRDRETWLLLQYLNNQKYAYEKLVFCSDFGKELMEYIRNHDPNYERV